VKTSAHKCTLDGYIYAFKNNSPAAEHSAALGLTNLRIRGSAKLTSTELSPSDRITEQELRGPSTKGARVEVPKAPREWGLERACPLPTGKGSEEGAAYPPQKIF